MPYALFSNDAKLSKTYPTEADVWKVAQEERARGRCGHRGGKGKPAPGAGQ